MMLLFYLKKKIFHQKIFKVLLTYIYNGIISIDNLNAAQIVELLEACDELNLDELINDLQDHLIKEKKEWVQQNLIYAHTISSQHQSFNLLQDYCSEITSKNPELFFKSNNITMIEKSMLINMLERDDLELKEIDIWDIVIQWGKNQNKKLNKEVSEWMKEDFIMLKNELDDIILLIRFYEISSIDFYDKIKPYKKIFNKEIYEELLHYQITGRCQPRFILQKGPRSKTAISTGQLLNSQTKSLISNWIDCKNNLYNENNTPYKFELIFQGTQHGFTRYAFEDKCYNIKETAIILKTGGYNPVGWNKEERSSNDSYYIELDKSFIFKIDQNDTTLSTKL